MIKFLISILIISACKTSSPSIVAATTEISPTEILDLTKYSATDEDYRQFRKELGDKYKLALDQLNSGIDEGSRKIPDDFKQLTEEESVAIYHYSSMGYRDLNKVLRKPDIDADRLASFRAGDFFVDRGFMSTSLHDGDGIRQAFGCREALYTIKSLFGGDISPLAVIPNEREILFVAGSEFRIDKIANTYPPDIDVLTLRKRRGFPRLAPPHGSASGSAPHVRGGECYALH